MVIFLGSRKTQRNSLLRRSSTVMSARSFWKRAFAPFLVLAVAHTVGLAQYTTQEYAAYESAINADPAKREDAIIEFIETNPRSTLVEYATSSYLQLMQEYQNQGEIQKVLSAGEKFVSIRPDNFQTLFMTGYAAFSLRQFEKATKYAENAYAQNPDGGIAFILAMSYLSLKNDDKVIEYEEKACAESAPPECVQLFGPLSRIYFGRKQWIEAAQYAKRSIEALDAAERPAQSPEREWNEYITKQKAAAYAIIGREAAERKSWEAVISNYGNVLRISEDSALNSEAYYYTGRGQWEQKQMDSAMEAFAKGSIQRGAPHAKHCRQYLETLYKSSHNGSLAGLEEFVERVTR